MDDGWMAVRMDGWTNGSGFEYCYRCMSTASTEAINSTATAISTLPDTAVTSAYTTIKAGPWLAQWEYLYCDLSRDIL